MTCFAPRSLRSQVLLVVVASLMLAQGFSLWLFADERDLAVRAALSREALDRAANVVMLIERATPNTELAVLQAASSPLLRFTVDAEPTLDHADHATRATLADLRQTLGSERDVRIELHEVRGVMPPIPGLPEAMNVMHHEMSMSAVELQFSARLADGRWLNVTSRFHRPPLQWAWVDLATFSLTAMILLIAVWAMLGRIVRPIGLLSVTADRMGRGDWQPEIVPSGPGELKRLTVAFNHMQSRLKRFVDERAGLLAALGHDLRSPLTALRVRAEMVDDEDTRRALNRSISEMQELLDATLIYARGTNTSEPIEDRDVAAFLAELVADYVETGRDVALTLADGPIIAPIRPVALRRAFRNLIDNALRYGSLARLTIRGFQRDVSISVDDNGPGLTNTDLDRVFEPFVRLETSRSRDTGGTGLGLPIAQAIVRAHGGDVTLSNREAGGLRAEVTLPLSAMDRKGAE
ncbi:ATP-binding protein [Pararhodobacter sp.]|uniref:ATP-binding protein n=1 Tax=Pararhodobacter sp. TaxID=2127056 RepID=UPI002AFEB151|nr:ATP-binding protein [Pararhodobacter sp.]